METGTKLGIAIALLAAAGVGGYFFWKSKQDEEEDYSDDVTEDKGVSTYKIIDGGVLKLTPAQILANKQGKMGAPTPQLTPAQILALKKEKMQPIEPVLTPAQILANKQGKMQGAFDGSSPNEY